MNIAPRSHLLFVGDSVTDCGRARPVGSGPGDALGFGYVAEVAALLAATTPGGDLRITNMGTGGDTVRNLAARWSTDVVALRPDWLSVMIGINDVWRQFDGCDDPAVIVHPDEYERTLGRLLAEMKPLVKHLVVMSPYYIEPRREEPMRRRMDEYGALAGKLARVHGATFVDTQAAFDRVLAHSAPSAWSDDHVHPNRAGHMVLALAFLDAIGWSRKG